MKIYFRFLILFYVFLTGTAIYLLSYIPTEKEIKGCMVTKMYKVRLCPGSSEYVPLRQISSHMVKSVILTEDSNFYNHNGFDWDAIQASAEANFESGKYLRGGSTISQQLAKNMFLTRDKTLVRKGLEAIITYRLEKVLSKREILERYFNVVQFGKNLFGIKNAAHYYFLKSPAQLNVAESAFLAMLLPSPEKYSRSFFVKALTPFAFKRIQRIVTDMYKYQRIDREEYEQAKLDVASLFGGSQRLESDKSPEEKALDAKEGTWEDEDSLLNNEDEESEDSAEE